MRFATISILFFLLSAHPGYAQGWEWQNPRPHGETVNDILMIDAAHGVAVCNNGYYLYSADGGRSWATYRLGYSNLERIIAAADGSLILVSDRQRIYRSTDRAYSWQLVYSIESFNRLPVYDLQRTPDGTLLAMLNGPHFVRSTDNGQSWTPWENTPLLVSNETPRSISVQSDATWFLLTSWALYRTTDAGGHWETVLGRDDARMIVRFVFIDEMYGYQLREGQLLRTRDGGVTWEEMDIYGFGTVLKVAAGPVLGDAVYCMSYGRYLVNASPDGGENWNISLTENAFADGVPAAMSFVDAATGFVAGDGGRILRTEDGGQSWSIVHGIGYIGTITDLLFLDDDFGIATTYTPTVLLTSNGGRRWDEAIPSSEHNCDAIAASPGGILYLVGTTPNYDFDLLRSTNRGQSWELLSRLPLDYSSTNPEMAQSILAVTDDDILVGGTFGLLLRSRDGGLSWDRGVVQPGISSPYSTGTDIFHFPPSTFIYMQSNGLQYSTDDGQTWEGRLTPRARSLWEAQFVTPEVGFGLISGEFSRTTDGGLTWETTEDFTPQLIHFFDANNGLLLWSDSQQEDLTFVMKSTDGGHTWEKFSMGERAGYNGWCFRSPSRMWGYGYGGAIRYNGDGGIVSVGSASPAAASTPLLSGYPNPFSPATHSAFRIPFSTAPGEAVRITLFDLLGRERHSVSVSAATGGEVTLPGAMLRGLEAGMYVYRLSAGSTAGMGRLTIR